MKRVREFEVWSKPGRVLSPDYGKDIQADVWALGVPRDVFLGISSFPDQSDVDRLESLLAVGQVTSQQFERFCIENGLEGKVQDQDSAARFVEFQLGRPLAWVHIPEGDGSAALLQRVTEVVHGLDLIVVDPD